MKNVAQRDVRAAERQMRVFGESPEAAGPEHTHNSSATLGGVENPAPSKWKKLDWLRENSALRRLRACSTRANSDTVRVTNMSGKVSIGNVMRCGSRVCPVCSELKASETRENITKVVTQHRERGGTVLFGTLTVRHKRSDSFDRIADAITKCWGAVASGRAWMRDRREAGVRFNIRVWEQKWSESNGWHVHVHFLLLVEPGYAVGLDITELLGSMFGRWRRKAEQLGLGVALIRAQDMHWVSEDCPAEVLGDYFAKQVTDEATAHTAKQLGLEMSAGNGKTDGRGYTPSQILDLAMSGDELMRALWAEYEVGMQGRRCVAYSHGLRAFFGLGDEKSADELAAVVDEEAEEKGTQIVLSSRGFKKLNRFRGRRAEMCGRLVGDGPESVVQWLRSWGVSAVVGRIDKQVQFVSDAESREGDGFTGQISDLPF